MTVLTISWQEKKNCSKSQDNVRYFALGNRKKGVSRIICQWIECDKLT